jgi:hypothetical protein
MIIALTISILINIAALFAVYNLLTKLEKFEEVLEESDTFIQDELKRNEALLEALRQIDNRQMFEKDDDVGSIFNQIKETINRFKNR